MEPGTGKLSIVVSVASPCVATWPAFIASYGPDDYVHWKEPEIEHEALQYHAVLSFSDWLAVPAQEAAPVDVIMSNKGRVPLNFGALYAHIVGKPKKLLVFIAENGFFTADPEAVRSLLRLEYELEATGDDMDDILLAIESVLVNAEVPLIIAALERRLWHLENSITDGLDEVFQTTEVADVMMNDDVKDAKKHASTLEREARHRTDIRHAIQKRVERAGGGAGGPGGSGGGDGGSGDTAPARLPWIPQPGQYTLEEAMAVMPPEGITMKRVDSKGYWRLTWKSPELGCGSISKEMCRSWECRGEAEAIRLLAVFAWGEASRYGHVCPIEGLVGGPTP